MDNAMEELFKKYNSLENENKSLNKKLKEQERMLSKLYKICYTVEKHYKSVNSKLQDLKSEISRLESRIK